jgi:hypothetical protein
MGLLLLGAQAGGVASTSIADTIGINVTVPAATVASTITCTASAVTVSVTVPLPGVIGGASTSVASTVSVSVTVPNAAVHSTIICTANAASISVTVPEPELGITFDCDATSTLISVTVPFATVIGGSTVCVAGASDISITISSPEVVLPLSGTITNILVVGDDGLIVVPPNHKIGGQVFSDFTLYTVTMPRITLPDEAPSPDVLPDLYEYLPEIIRQMDSEFVDRPSVPAYLWDTTPEWDVSPYTWDEVIGPEPILKTTIRVMQLELERSAREIRDLVLCYNVNRAKREYLPYISELLGADLPSGLEKAQRSFLSTLASTYRKKGTPLAIQYLFESFGFSSQIYEKYQRKNDGTFVNGPQKTMIASSLVRDEPVGYTLPIAGPYNFTLLNTPIVRGSVRISLYGSSNGNPTVIVDDSEGYWSNDFVGSIDYITGYCTITLPSPTALEGGGIKATYNFQTDAFPDPFNRRWVDQFRSSYASVIIRPFSPAISLTSEISKRMLIYLMLMKPAHVILEPLKLELEYSENEYDPANDKELDIQAPMTIEFVESLYGTMYHGVGWDLETNGSMPCTTDDGHVIPARGGPEFNLDSDLVPRVYPFRRDGKFYQPNATDDWKYDWYSPYPGYTALVTADITPPTVTSFSIAYGALPYAGFGTSEYGCFITGTLGGEAQYVTVTDKTTYWKIDVDSGPGYPVAPTVGDEITLVDKRTVGRNGLIDRREDQLQVRVTESTYTGTGTVFVGDTLTYAPIYYIPAP